MPDDSVLIVDDEENIRFTLSQALARLPADVETASGGDEALAKVQQRPFSLILLDLRMPGMDGMDVLRRLAELRPEIPVLIITAHGTINSAVEAMKLGAVDFLQKPFTPEEVRTQSRRILERRRLPEGEANDYAVAFELAKKCLTQRNLDAAAKHLRKAISIASDRPEAFNLLGVIHEIRGQRHEALNNYRTAWNFDPTYKPAQNNIERAASEHPRRGTIDPGELRVQPKRSEGAH
jgi:DNA-binding response OmpR family regulator